MEKKENILKNDYINRLVILNGSEYKYNSKKLKGGKLSSIMAANTVILTEADIDGNSLTLDLFAFWGAIEIYIPKNWEINIKCMPILGYIGQKKKSENSKNKKNKTLIIKGRIIMSSVEIFS